MYRLVWLLIIASVLCSCRSAREPVSGGEGAVEITVTSAAFKDGDMLPVKYSCDGAGISPPLAWSRIPSGAKSIALVCEDPDAPRGTFIHWVLFNLPANAGSLPEGVPAQKKLSNGAIQGTNDAGRIGYFPPSPPSGTHRYIFKVYALDTMLDLQPGAAGDDLAEAMEGHILAEGELMGRYSRG